ncbi:MAG: glycosyltransferase family 4 protein [Planctomycetia bacterium]|nr:glycosyltransferase family 4 protein [Planctomycetia bacterium]
MLHRESQLTVNGAISRVAHVCASRFFGGPERQMLGLAAALAPECGTTFVSFAENGLCRDFLDRAGREGFEAIALRHDTPRLAAARRELTDLLRTVRPDVLCCHGYKANLLGLRAARRLGTPVVSVSRGWTGESFRVRLYERLDRRVLRRMDRVVCVSNGQAEKVRRAGVPEHKIRVIHNAVRVERFDRPDPAARGELESLFPQPPRFLVAAAGRLSPEKGFDVLIDAAAQVVRQSPGVGFVVFGDGALREPLEAQIRSRGLKKRFVLAGFRDDLDRFFPHFDLLALPSHTEGLPNVVLEAMAAGVPVVATAVGGTQEVVDDGETGHLVPAGDSAALAHRIIALASNPDRAREMGQHGRERVEQEFSFDTQAKEYRALFAQLAVNSSETGRHEPQPA